MTTPVERPDPAMLRARAVRGTAWTLLGFGASSVFRLGTNLVLAHLLFPAAFGLLELANLVVQALRMLSDLGMGLTLVSHPDAETPTFMNTAWTVQVIRGVALTLLACLLAWPLSLLYDEPALLPVIPFAASALLIGGFNSIMLPLETRRLRLGRQTLLATLETAVKSVVMLLWALVSPSVWALVGGLLASRLVYTASTHLALPRHEHRFALAPAALTAILRNGRWIALSTAITFFGMQADRLLLGKLMTIEFLGVYAVALRLAQLPRDVFARLLEAVLFPLLAERARDEPARLARTLVNARSVVLPAAGLVVAGLVLAAPWFFRLLYDARYADATWIAPLLGIGTWSWALRASADRALLALGDTRPLAIASAANLTGVAVGGVLGFDLAAAPGFVVGTGLGSVLGHAVVSLALAQRGLGTHRQDARHTAVLLAALALAIAPSALMAPTSPARPLLELLAGAVVLGGYAAWTARVVLPVWRQRRADRHVGAPPTSPS